MSIVTTTEITIKVVGRGTRKKEGECCVWIQEIFTMGSGEMVRNMAEEDTPSPIKTFTRGSSRRGIDLEGGSTRGLMVVFMRENGSGIR